MQKQIPEIISLAKQGQTDPALEILKTLLFDSPKNAQYIATMGFVYEQIGDMATARYLYAEALKHAPSNQSIIKQAKNCESKHQNTIRQSQRLGKGRIKLLFFVIFLLSSVSILITIFHAEVGQIVYELTGIRVSDYFTIMLIAGLVMGAIGLSFLILALKTRLQRRKAIAGATGPNFRSKQYTLCWNCSLLRLRKEISCSFCGASKKQSGQFTSVKQKVSGATRQAKTKVQEDINIFTLGDSKMDNKPTDNGSPVETSANAGNRSNDFFAKFDGVGTALLERCPAEQRPKLPWVYRGSLFVALISCLFPWVQASGSASIMGQVSRASFSVAGTATTWGTIALVVSLIGIGLSLINPATFFYEKARIIMCSVGIVIALCALFVLFRSGTYVEGGAGYRDDYGNYASSHSGAAFGLYLSLVSGGIAAMIGLAFPWKPYPQPETDSPTNVDQ